MNACVGSSKCENEIFAKPNKFRGLQFQTHCHDIAEYQKVTQNNVMFVILI